MSLFLALYDPEELALDFFGYGTGLAGSDTSFINFPYGSQFRGSAGKKGLVEALQNVLFSVPLANNLPRSCCLNSAFGRCW